MNIPTLRSPLVFIHGMGGFDQLRLGRWVVARYWANIPDALEDVGNRVHVARVSPLGSVAERAAQLKQFINRHCPGEPVHLFAHSMGGLDSRYMISRLGMGDRVLSLTTIATPHRGSAFADWGLRYLEPVFSPFLDLFGVSRQAFRDVSRAGCRDFNRQVPDVPGVRYFSVAGRFKADWLSPQWGLSWRVVEKEEGPNDGLVSVASAAYGEDCAVWEGDHISLVNCPPLSRMSGRHTERLPAYIGLVRRLADEGF
jgi:triacylglycerol lipase